MSRASFKACAILDRFEDVLIGRPMDVTPGLVLHDHRPWLPRGRGNEGGLESRSSAAALPKSAVLDVGQWPPAPYPLA